jgi:hypothetical protein
MSVINGSFSALTCTGNISFPIGFALYRDFTGLLNVCDIQIRGLFSSTFSATTGNFSKINVSNVSFTGLGPKMSMGGLGEIFGVGTYTGLNCNVSQINASNISTINLSATTTESTNMSCAQLLVNTSALIARMRVDRRLESSAGFAISDFNQSNASSYALAQFSAGRTVVNAAANNVIEFRNGAVTVADIGVNGMTFVANKLMNCSNISCTNFSGDLGTFSDALTIGGALTLTNQPRFLAYYQGATAPLVINANEVLFYNTVKYNLGGGNYNNTSCQYTIPQTGYYEFYCGYFTNKKTRF